MLGGRRPLSSVCMCVCQHFQTSSPLKPPIEVKFHMEPPWDGGTKICSNGPGHMTKMAIMPIYGKNLKNFFSGTKKLMSLKCGMQLRVLKYYQICSK